MPIVNVLHYRLLVSVAKGRGDKDNKGKAIEFTGSLKEAVKQAQQ